MDTIGPLILGTFIIVLGIFNMRGNISSIHWYHRRRVTEENRIPFGRLVGGGTVIIGISLIMYALLWVVEDMTETGLYTMIGVIVIAAGIVIGLGLSLWGMIKYNKGIF